MYKRRALAILGLCAFALLASSNAGHALTCKEIGQSFTFPDSSDVDGSCAGVSTDSASCPKGYSLTGGGCSCSGCGPMESNSVSKQGTTWNCNFTPQDINGTCQGSTINVRILCCK